MESKIEEVTVFFSPKCSACSKVQDIIPMFPKIKFNKVNVLEFKDEAKRAGVRFIPTYKIKKDGADYIVEGNDLDLLKKYLN